MTGEKKRKVSPTQAGPNVALRTGGNTKLTHRTLTK